MRGLSLNEKVQLIDALDEVAEAAPDELLPELSELAALIVGL